MSKFVCVEESAERQHVEFQQLLVVAPNLNRDLPLGDLAEGALLVAHLRRADLDAIADFSADAKPSTLGT